MKFVMEVLIYDLQAVFFQFLEHMIFKVTFPIKTEINQTSFLKHQISLKTKTGPKMLITFFQSKLIELGINRTFKF
jgi:hypothetical protein